MNPSSDVAFTKAVKAIQTQRGSRGVYERVEASGGFETEVTDELARFVAERDSVYLATASAAGQPYVQHRGGPKGFIHVLDPRTLAWADYRGNRQYVTVGNLAENDRAFLFLMDYARRERVKIWGRARIVADDAALLDRLTPAGYRARPEHAVVFAVEAWDANCPQHIPEKLDAAEVRDAMLKLQTRVEALEAENARLRAALERGAPGALRGSRCDRPGLPVREGAAVCEPDERPRDHELDGEVPREPCD